MISTTRRDEQDPLMINEEAAIVHLQPPRGQFSSIYSLDLYDKDLNWCSGYNLQNKVCEVDEHQTPQSLNVVQIETSAPQF